MNEGGGDEWRWMTLYIWISLAEDKYWKCFFSISLLHFRYWYAFVFLIITIIIIGRLWGIVAFVLLAFFTSLNLVNPVDQVPKQIYNQSFADYLHGLSGEPDLPAYIYCWLNALSAHSDPTNIGAASDQLSSSSSATTAGARRSFRSDYLSKQSDVTSGLVQNLCRQICLLAMNKLAIFLQHTDMSGIDVH